MEKTINLSGERISRKREELQYTQEDLAKKCSVSVSTIKNWESGAHFPGKKELLRLAVVLCTTPNYFYGFDEEKYFVLQDTTAVERRVLNEMHELYHLQLDSLSK